MPYKNGRPTRICRKCGQRKMIVGRGECRTCYGRTLRGIDTPFVRQRPLLDPKDGSNEAGEWMIVGTRPDGSRVVIKEKSTPAEANDLADRMRGQLEGYAAVVVEKCRCKFT